MLTIYKYPFAIADSVTLELPGHAMILHVDTFGGQPCLWAMVNTDSPPGPRTFRIFGTGHQIDKATFLDGKYIATFKDGPFVWHMFEVRQSRGKHDPV